jgi:hypothetical protein
MVYRSIGISKPQVLSKIKSDKKKKEIRNNTVIDLWSWRYVRMPRTGVKAVDHLKKFVQHNIKLWQRCVV